MVDDLYSTVFLVNKWSWRFQIAKNTYLCASSPTSTSTHTTITWKPSIFSNIPSIKLNRLNPIDPLHNPRTPPIILPPYPPPPPPRPHNPDRPPNNQAPTNSPIRITIRTPLHPRIPLHPNMTHLHIHRLPLPKSPPLPRHNPIPLQRHHPLNSQHLRMSRRVESNQLSAVEVPRRVPVE